MKKLFTFLFLVVAFATIGFGQTRVTRVTTIKPTAENLSLRFQTAEQCLAVLKQGGRYYRPTFMSGHKPLSLGEEVRGLEAPACVRMKAVGGIFWVPQAENDEVVIKNNQVVRRWDCGNEIFQVSYLEVVETSTPTPQPTPVQTPAPTPQAPKVCEMGNPEVVGLTFSQARRLGYEVDESTSTCTKVAPQPQPITVCSMDSDKDARGKTFAWAQEKGYNIDQNTGRCYKEKQGMSTGKKVLIGAVIGGGALAVLCGTKVICGKGKKPAPYNPPVQPPVVPVKTVPTNPTTGQPQTPNRGGLFAPTLNQQRPVQQRTSSSGGFFNPLGQQRNSAPRPVRKTNGGGGFFTPRFQ